MHQASESASRSSPGERKSGPLARLRGLSLMLLVWHMELTLTGSFIQTHTEVTRRWEAEGRTRSAFMERWRRETAVLQHFNQSSGFWKRFWKGIQLKMETFEAKWKPIILTPLFTLIVFFVLLFTVSLCIISRQAITVYWLFYQLLRCDCYLQSKRKFWLNNSNFKPNFTRAMNNFDLFRLQNRN